MVTGAVRPLVYALSGSTVPIFAALLAIEKLVTVYHAHHYVNEFLPVGTPDSSGHLAPR